MGSRAAFILVCLLSVVTCAQAKYDIPKITSRVELPAPADKDTPKENNAEGFIVGHPTVIDDATKKKLNELADTYVKVAKDNYPLIIKTLHLEGKPATCKNVHIVVTYSYNGVAATSGGGFGNRTGEGPTIQVSAKYALAHPNDVGMIVHEMVHVVQAYPKYDPVWLVEGIADYVRWFFYEPEDKRPHPKLPRADARASYQTTAAFLFWAANKYDKDLVVKLSAAFQADAYKEELFKQITGKTLDELNTEWKSTLPAPNAPALRG